MSEEVYSFFKARRDKSKQKRASNKDRSTQVLVDEKIEFQSFNEGFHLKVKAGSQYVDFWPSTGLWMVGDKRGRGVVHLVKMVNELENE